MSVTTLANWAHDQFNITRKIDGIAPLALRLYLFVPFWMAGTNKWAGFENTVAWFGNADWGLGLPFPTLLAGLVTGTEILGAIFLVFGFAVRWISIPMLITMLVAAVTVHSQNGWLAISEGTGFFANDRTIAAVDRLSAAKAILQEYGNYEWLTEQGSFVILNNGIEFAMTYSIMLLVLIFMGAGNYLSIDYYIKKNYQGLS